MPPILNAQGLGKKFGATPLFWDVAFTVSEGERIGLIGPNGAGKSTLLGCLAGVEEPDAGEVAMRRRARVGYVRQDSDFAKDATVRSVLMDALERAGVAEGEREGRLRETAGRLGFEGVGASAAVAGSGSGSGLEARAAALSGGWKKRLSIAEATVTGPDVLLLDEPTNHLDLEGIEWLEGMLRTAPFAAVMVSHDRYFLENVATEIVELNRVYAEGMLRVRGSYSKFLEGRELYLESQTKMQESLRNRVRTEVEWLRRGPKARATKAKARIDNAHELIGQLKDVDARTRTGSAGIEFAATDRQTKRLVEMEDVGVSLPPPRTSSPGTPVTGGREIVRGLNFTIANGMRVGLVGPNGAGKTTILRLITGELEPTEGVVKRAGQLRMVYFSQMRELPEGVTLRRALAPDSDSVVYAGRVVHVASYAAKFLFTGEQLNQPVERLSGGERARVLIARLMLQPADVLLMDEPTNDLDIPTLEILEESLREFAGALVLVTHDRYLLDRVATVVLGLDGKGTAEVFADYRQWEEWRGVRPGTSDGSDGEEKAAAPAAASGGKKKLSYMEAREFAGIEGAVEAADERLEAARERVEDPAVALDAKALTEALAEMEAAQAEMDRLYARWAELTEKAG